MNWRDRPVLVTGATGFLGGHLIQALMARGAAVTVIVRDRVPKFFHADVSQAHGDVTDQAFAERVLAEYDIKTVFHLAAQTQVTVANKSPIGTFDSNIRGTWSVLEACRRVGVEQIIVASSDKAYGVQDDLPYKEDTPLNPLYPYDVSKACAEMIARVYAETYGLPVGITRCGNLYGPGDLNWQRIVPGTIRSIAQGAMPQIRSNGQLKRDYFYVGDAAEAYLLLAEKLKPELYGQAFNFSPGAPISVVDLVGKIALALDWWGEVEIRDLATGEIADQYLDSDKARIVLGWEPKWTLDAGLAKTIAWYKSYLEVPVAVA